MNSLIVAFLLLLCFQWSVVSAQHYRIEKICLSDFQNAKIQKIRVFLEQNFYFFYPKCYRFRLNTYNIQYKNPLYALHVYIFIVRISVFNGGHKRTNLLHKNSYMFMVLLGHFIVIPVSMFNTPKHAEIHKNLILQVIFACLIRLILTCTEYLVSLYAKKSFGRSLGTPIQIRSYATFSVDFSSHFPLSFCIRCIYFAFYLLFQDKYFFWKCVHFSCLSSFLFVRRIYTLVLRESSDF